MKIDFSMSKDWVVASIDGRVDSFTYPLLESDLMMLIRTGMKKIALDLLKNHHMNLNGYKLIKKTHESLRNSSGELVIVSTSDEFKERLNYFVSEGEIQIGDKLEDFIEK